jgi:uncharacterized protein (DUF3820 family)
MIDRDSIQMPFGRFRGRALPLVPGVYLRALYAEGRDWLREPLKSAIKAELVRRGLPFGKYQGVPLDDLPDSYLSWLGTIELRAPLDRLVEEVAEARERERARAWLKAERKRDAKKKTTKRKSSRQEK